VVVGSRVLFGVRKVVPVVVSFDAKSTSTIGTCSRTWKYVFASPCCRDVRAVLKLFSGFFAYTLLFLASYVADLTTARVNQVMGVG